MFHGAWRLFLGPKAPPARLCLHTTKAPGTPSTPASLVSFQRKANNICVFFFFLKGKGKHGMSKGAHCLKDFSDTKKKVANVGLNTGDVHSQQVPKDIWRNQRASHKR